MVREKSRLQSRCPQKRCTKYIKLHIGTCKLCMGTRIFIDSHWNLFIPPTGNFSYCSTTSETYRFPSVCWGGCRICGKGCPALHRRDGRRMWKPARGHLHFRVDIHSLQKHVIWIDREGISHMVQEKKTKNTRPLERLSVKSFVSGNWLAGYFCMGFSYR